MINRLSPEKSKDIFTKIDLTRCTKYVGNALFCLSGQVKDSIIQASVIKTINAFISMLLTKGYKKE